MIPLTLVFTPDFPWENINLYFIFLLPLPGQTYNNENEIQDESAPGQIYPVGKTDSYNYLI